MKSCKKSSSDSIQSNQVDRGDLSPNPAAGKTNTIPLNKQEKVKSFTLQEAELCLNGAENEADVFTQMMKQSIVSRASLPKNRPSNQDVTKSSDDKTSKKTEPKPKDDENLPSIEEEAGHYESGSERNYVCGNDGGYEGGDKPKLDVIDEGSERVAEGITDSDDTEDDDADNSLDMDRLPNFIGLQA